MSFRRKPESKKLETIKLFSKYALGPGLRRDDESHVGCHPDCRGCAHRGLSASESEAQKRQWLAKSLAPWASMLALVQAVSEQQRWAYRDRVCLHALWDVGWQVGMLRREELIPIPHCPVHSERVRQALAILSAVLPTGESFPLAYYVQAGAQITLVLKSATLPSLDWFDDQTAQALQAAGVEGLWLHLFPSVGKRIFQKRDWHLVWGEARSRDEDGMLYGPTAFQQLLPELSQAALGKAQAFLQPSEGDAVLDLYCGNGRSLHRWTEAGADALGVEVGADAVACATINAPGAKVLRGTCAHRLLQVGEWADGQTKRRLVYANPPRTGLEPEVAEWLVHDYRPERIAYLSCSAGTQARDLEKLCSGGYEVVSLTPYDFFPRTHHVECLALLQAVT